MNPMQQLKQFILLAIFFAGAVLPALGSWSCSGKSSPIRIGTTNSEVNLLILIAQDQDYFTANGLDITVKIYPSGKAAVDGMLNNEVDMATQSEYAFAGNVLDGKNVRTIGIINRSSVEYLVGRIDKGINDIPDLRGKRIGVPLNSRPEFALGRFLDLNGIETSEVTLVNVNVNQSASALANGEVDAVATWQPHINQAIERLDGGTVIWSVQSGQPSYNAVICTDEWTIQNPDLIKRFLKSLTQAESYYINHTEAAKTIVKKRLNYTDEYMASVWPDYQFYLSLDESLIAAMEDETRWMMNNDLTTKKAMPNFLDSIYIDGLKTVKPEAVNVIH